MRRILLILPILLCALASSVAAQGTRPARDSIQMAEVEEPDEAEEEASADVEDAEQDTVAVPADGPYARSGGSGPFSVQASGEVAPRPERGEVVWVNTRPAPRVTARDTAQRVTSGQTTRRDTASTTRPATSRDTARTGPRVSTSQPARRDTASTTRPASRDTARTGSRVTTNQPARRDTASTTRPAAGRTGSTPAPSGRARAHTVVAGETFYGIARRYGVTAAQLRALNPDVDMDALEVGDELRLPAAARDSRAGAQPRPQAPASTGAQTQQPRGTRSHVVASGETLFGIARRYGVTVDAIRRANQMETDQVRVGQRIVIPPAS